MTKNKIFTSPTKLFLLALLILALIVAIIVEVQAHLKFNEISKELTRIEQVSITPAGGKEDKTPPYNDRTVGGIEDFLKCIHRCPAEQKTWQITIAPEKEEGFIYDIFTENGFTLDDTSQQLHQAQPCDLKKTNSCSAQGTDSKHMLGVTLNANNGNQQNTPRTLVVNVTNK
jgi:hypothetical protein